MLQHFIPMLAGVATGLVVFRIYWHHECAQCGTTLPSIRRPKNMRQALWGGWTCPNCGTETNAHGEKIM